MKTTFRGTSERADEIAMKYASPYTHDIGLTQMPRENLNDRSPCAIVSAFLLSLLRATKPERIGAIADD